MRDAPPLSVYEASGKLAMIRKIYIPFILSTSLVLQYFLC